MTPTHHLRQLLAEATPGPWHSREYTNGDTLVVEIGDAMFVLAQPNVRDVPASADAALIVAAVNALPALLAIAEAAQEVLRCEDDITEPDYVLNRATESLRTALSLLPIAKAQGAPASGAQVQRLVGRSND
jgi:hypothetical protein